MDNTCFGYTLKNKGTEIIEMCTPLHEGNCEECRFYKQPHILQHEREIAEQRNRKLAKGILKTNYSLYVDGEKEGEFETIEDIDTWLVTSEYNKGYDEIKGKVVLLDLDDIYARHKIRIRKEDVR